MYFVVSIDIFKTFRFIDLVFVAETSVPEVVNIKSIEEEIEKEKQRIEELKQKLQAKNTINK